MTYPVCKQGMGCVPPPTKQEIDRLKRVCRNDDVRPADFHVLAKAGQDYRKGGDERP